MFRYRFFTVLKSVKPTCIEIYSTVADLGEGPGCSLPNPPLALILRPNGAPKGGCPPYLRVWMTGSPLSRGLDPALICTILTVSCV